MDFQPGEAEESYRQEVRRFAGKVLAPHNQADDRAARLRPALVAELAGMGLTGLRIPETHGGRPRWRLTGEKTSITLGAGAHTALILARTGGPGARGVSAFYAALDDRYAPSAGRHCTSAPGMCATRRCGARTAACRTPPRPRWRSSGRPSWPPRSSTSAC